MFERIAILGPGLLGGSIALALRSRSPDSKVSLWARRAEAVREAQALGVADSATTDLASAVSDCDLIILATPIGAMPDLIKSALPHIKRHAIVTDVGSVKQPVVDALEPILSSRAHFVGSHPMAGSEQSGLAAARPDLFNRSVCITTSTPETNPDALKATCAFWESLGCHVRSLTPADHDRTVALVSHLPHLVAATLVDLVCTPSADPLQFCGNGFRDTTRIASGPAEMWREILLENRGPMIESLSRMISALNDARTALENRDGPVILGLLSRAKSQRDAAESRKDQWRISE